eukprot:5023764-Pyramimonas_sp.AAC.1
MAPKARQGHPQIHPVGGRPRLRVPVLRYPSWVQRIRGAVLRNRVKKLVKEKLVLKLEATLATRRNKYLMHQVNEIGDRATHAHLVHEGHSKGDSERIRLTSAISIDTDAEE